MSRKIITAMGAVLALLLVHFGVQAAPVGTAEEAKGLAEKSVQLIQAQGNDKAYQAFNDPGAGFVDRDLYVFVIDLQGNVLAHGANKALIGKSLIGLKDADGKTFVQSMVETAKSAGSGWVDYKWSNPTTKKVELKSSYVQRVGDVFVGVGIYKG